MTHKAVLLYLEKVEYADGDIVEVKAWSVEPSPAKPEGIKYSLVYVGKDGTRILGYDNAEGKGHHKHLGGRELPSEFTTIETMVERFTLEVTHLRRRMT